MTKTATAIFVQGPRTDIATLTGATAVTGRGNITGTTGLTALVPTTTNGYRLDLFMLKWKGNSVAGLVGIWVYDGTTSYLWKEFDASTVVTASNTVASKEQSYDMTAVALALKPTESLWVSQTVSQDLTVFAFGGEY